MSEGSLKVPTPVGPVKVDLIVCDQCGKRSQEEMMLNWYKLSHQGIEARTMAQGHWTDMDFCSIDCLKAMFSGN